ncbi:MAG: Transporter, CPA2 family [Candidatus Uhrbacteria bacterium GW2011_GWF2_41_16]|uniref:Transporter, CPA2 family n=2 Tax=Candidatus Uhriibacteriota TaxID=1752732 RepID=A0A0G0XMI9_9BACT|nr:MAG: Transporter, CPA2 family [Candidatus Uhrbacteria bacterium GW2011_GWC2_41_11]KKR98015.1 MAG: Transporter, CPA2 family [Candidatus Uhrbacteria bacterium GW2011_GWF2_41_16]
MSLESLFFEIGGVLVAAAGFSFLAYLLRQPLIIAYILTGLFVGPNLLAVTHASDVFDTLSQIGVAFLLFTVGMGLNWKRVKEVGGVALASGAGQVLFTSLIGWFVARALGFDLITSIFLSIAFSFSSTIIIIKLLMDKDDLETLYGKISVGFLLVQDVIAMIILLVVGSLKQGGELGDVLGSSFLKGALVVIAIWFLSKYVVPSVVRMAAASQELLLLFALGWCFAVAGLLVFFGFGVEMGALIAGISLSGTPFEREIHARVRPLRDFFLVLFFIMLGTHLPLADIGIILRPAMIFSFFILFGNPIIMLLVMRALGYHPQTGFLAGTTVGQISEFSFIMLGAGIVAGYIPVTILPLATFVGLLTIGVSTYLIKYNEQLYEHFRPLLRWLEKGRIKHEEHARRHATGPQAILFGYHRMGTILLPQLQKLYKKILVVDFDPQAVQTLAEQDIPFVYGDAGDEHFLEDLRVEHAKLIISTIPDVSISTSLLDYLHTHKYKGVVIVTVKQSEDADICYATGATYVIVPSVLSAERFQELLKTNREIKTCWKEAVV